MQIKINVSNGQELISGLPNECPHCHRAVTPNPLFGHNAGSRAEVFMFCPNDECNRCFIGYYKIQGTTWYFKGDTSEGSINGREFTKLISGISPDFIKIYNESFAAEQKRLLEICGIGYRKALEFLIKDYVILNNESKKDKIEKEYLGKCIETYLEDKKIKSVAKRAAWLGNDEAHYVRKWEGKNLDDLKKLIDLTLHWMEYEELTKSFEEEMPE